MLRARTQLLAGAASTARNADKSQLHDECRRTAIGAASAQLEERVRAQRHNC